MTDNYCIRHWLKWGKQYLFTCGVDSPGLDAEVLMMHALNTDRTGLYLCLNEDLSAERRQLFEHLVRRRGTRQPVSYLTGQKEFMGLLFKVNPSVLIPRPETELLVENAVKLLESTVFCYACPLVADVGTGSGAIAISIAHYVPNTRVFAIDISQEALETAEKNACRHGVSGKITFLSGNLLQPILQGDLMGKLSIIAANLPYISSADMDILAPEVGFEPCLALHGGSDGLELYRELLPQAYSLLHEGGRLLMEIGADQGPKALHVFENKDAGSWEVDLRQDLAGRDRLVVARKKAGV